MLAHQALTSMLRMCVSGLQPCQTGVSGCLCLKTGCLLLLFAIRLPQDWLSYCCCLHATHRLPAAALGPGPAPHNKAKPLDISTGPAAAYTAATAPGAATALTAPAAAAGLSACTAQGCCLSPHYAHRQQWQQRQPCRVSPSVQAVAACCPRRPWQQWARHVSSWEGRHALRPWDCWQQPVSLTGHCGGLAAAVLLLLITQVCTGHRAQGRGSQGVMA